MPPPRRPHEPAPPPPRAPRGFRIVDVLGGDPLAEDVGTRAAVEVLSRVRSTVDVRLSVRETERRRLLTRDEQAAMWKLRAAPVSIGDAFDDRAVTAGAGRAAALLILAISRGLWCFRTVGTRWATLRALTSSRSTARPTHGSGPRRRGIVVHPAKYTSSAGEPVTVPSGAVQVSERGRRGTVADTKLRTIGSRRVVEPKRTRALAVPSGTKAVTR